MLECGFVTGGSFSCGRRALQRFEIKGYGTHLYAQHVVISKIKIDLA